MIASCKWYIESPEGRKLKDNPSWENGTKLHDIRKSYFGKDGIAYAKAYLKDFEKIDDNPSGPNGGKPKSFYDMAEKAQKEREQGSTRYALTTGPIVDWAKPENLSRAMNDDGTPMTKSQIYSEFDNTPVRVAHIPEEYMRMIGYNTDDNGVYCSQAYFVDHAVNHHPSTTYEEYMQLQDVISNNDDIKEVYLGGKRSVVFIKMLTGLKHNYAGMAVQLEVGDDNKIIWHKTFFGQKKEPYRNSHSIKLPISASEDATPRSSALNGERTVGKRNISTPDAGGKVTSTSDNSNKEPRKLSLAKDSSGNSLTNGQAEYFKNSKAVDKDGNLLVLYHGTPRAGFNEFNGGWFTTSKKDADSYAGNAKGKIYDPEEKPSNERLTAGDFRVAYMTFDSKEDADEFIKQYPLANEAMTEAELRQAIDDAEWEGDDEKADELESKKKDFEQIAKAYLKDFEKIDDNPSGPKGGKPKSFYDMAEKAQKEREQGSASTSTSTSTSTRYSLRVPKQEYALISNAIATYPGKTDRGHVFTANNYYLCDNIDDENGTFDIIATLPIDGNEDLIRDIRKKNAGMVFIPIDGAEMFARYASDVRSRGGRISRNISSSKGRSGRNRQILPMDVRRSSKSTGNRPGVEEIHTQEGVVPSEQVDYGFNISDDTPVIVDGKEKSITQAILDGDKTIETRKAVKGTDRSPLPGGDFKKGARVALISTGRNRRGVVGYATIQDVKEYKTEEEWLADDPMHLMANIDGYKWDGTPRFGYVLTDVMEEKNPYTPVTGGHSFRNSKGIGGSKRFSLVTPEQDSEYRKAYEDGDTEKAMIILPALRAASLGHSTGWLRFG